MAVKVSQVSTTAGRKLRRPEHPFQIIASPWQIQPFMLAPVLPGETMKSLLMQARVVSDPVKSSLIGWWTEHYFFYVKHRDLDDRDAFTAMMLEPAKDMTAQQSAASVPYYHQAGSINWLEKCVKRITEEYFRDGDEAWNAGTLGGLPLAKVQAPGWTDNLTTVDPIDDADVNVDLNSDSNVMASEVERAMQQYQFMKMHNLTEMTYEDFLRAYGVRAARTELHRPELLRYSRNWSYPSATVNPADGVPNNAVVWSVAERADKDRYFAEPGFIVGVSVTRPKVYFSGQKSNVADYMMDAFSWLPPQLTNDMQVSLKKFAAGAGPISGAAEPYWLDVRDLLLYGDQFVNFSLTATDAGLVALPAADLAKKYVPESSITALFTYGAETTPRKYIRQDGIVMLNVLSPQRDQT
nr:MAG: major capsid protein [Microvirus sp.]